MKMSAFKAIKSFLQYHGLEVPLGGREKVVDEVRDIAITHHMPRAVRGRLESLLSLL